MDLHWMYVVAPIALVAVGSCIVVPLCSGPKHLDDRMTDQVTRSAALVKECAAAMDGETRFGRPPASR